MHPGALKAREAAVVPARLRHRRVNKNGGGSDTCWREEAVGPGAAQNAEEGRSRGGGERGSRPKGSLGARGAGQSPPPPAASRGGGGGGPRRLLPPPSYNRFGLAPAAAAPRPAALGMRGCPGAPGGGSCPRRAGNRGRRRGPGPGGPEGRRRRSGVRRGRGGEPGGGPRAGCPASRPAWTGQRGAPRGARHETAPRPRRPSQMPVGVQTPAGFRCAHAAVSAAGARHSGARRGAPSAFRESVRPSPCSRDVGLR